MRDFQLDVTPAAAAALALAYYLDDSGWFSAAIPAILCHEWGHWIAIRALGGHVTALRVELVGLCMESTAFSDRASEIAALAAGPIFGLLWGAAMGKLGGEWGAKSCLAALTLNAFNLLPVLPLDGGRILLALIGSMSLLRWTGIGTAAAMIFAAFRVGRWGFIIPAILFGIHALRS